MNANPYLAASLARRLALLGCMLLALAGCVDDINSEYGVQGGTGASSVNGTAVLAEMFEQAGHKVSVTTRLSPRVQERADVIVWTPDDFKPPSQKVRDWLESWLCDADGRTLIYVGRDYDAAITYWDKMQAGAPPAELAEIKVRLGRARSSFRGERGAMPSNEDCEWFTAEGAFNPRRVRSLKGDAEWLDGLDAKAADIELSGRFTPGGLAEVLIESKGDTLLTRQDVCDSQLFVVTNGSFLLNLPLVNKEHRKLANRLVDQVGEKRRVYFLESGRGGPRLLEHDNDAAMHSGLAILGIPPFNVILLHLAVLGVIFCFARLPLFGRPRLWETAAPSDFGKHIIALGKLLEATRDQGYAEACLAHYRKLINRSPKTKSAKR